MMPDYLEITVDKFTFRVATDCWYNATGVWVKPDEEGRAASLGLSDYLQQRSGDIAFVEVQPEGTELAQDDSVADIETIKVTIELPSPVSGKIVAVNPALDDAPEVINQDPYGEGWLAVVELADWETDKASLMDAQTYFEHMSREAEEESKNL
jgi:glycine cleavage system H protein